MSESQYKSPSIIDALIPVLALVAMLGTSVWLYGADSSYGANQIALIIAAGIAALIGIKNGHDWKGIEEGIVKGISTALGAILILLAVGSLIGSWILSGTVPTMIYFGLQILNPTFFYVAACIICALVSISIGSSWTTAGTIGVALMGIASGLGLSPEITAGAIISGAYFGDKMSPLSDTTNLAPAVAGTDLFTHIRHMAWTTVPSIILAIIIFLVIGIVQTTPTFDTDLSSTLGVLDKHFNISIWSLIPLFVVLGLAIKKFPAFPTIMIGALVGCVFAFLLQPEGMLVFAGESDHGRFVTQLNAAWTSLFNGFKITTENEAVNDLLSRGGMSSMLNTVWLILCALTFGAVLEKTELLQRLVISALALVHSTGSLIVTVICTCIGTNVVAGDQYIAIVLPGRMYKSEFKRRQLDPKNLSRVLEDSATITSPLIPWNTCGAYMAGTLGVATLAYLPFCFFNLINPVISIIYGLYNFKIEKLEDIQDMENTQKLATSEA
ncbi:Na+/H+ antiporter NhaC [Pleionea sp. CnH1-48]|uniref:Na+/H+ antiporter NhaC n=1 Tax=Pleionea sp. CnH1-48 TaxID=2954494 RepID=UPI002097E910|nr:Na+/H+ antiporter NhaC [Pleionea sp. CnH1-48]MCO7227260.1 Na+/H+ antiporter NhaC [Pleionea sp. CnH1-48]